MKFWNRLLLRLGGGRLESELNDEIRLHREMLEADFIRLGMTPREAVHAAARQFGNLSAAADWSRDEWSFPRLDAVLKDLRFACRLMLRHPLLTAAAALTVAFGVGANTAILSVLETVLLNPLGMRHTDGVMVARVRIDKIHMRHASDSGVEFREIQSMQDAFSAAAMENRAWNYRSGSEATRLLGRAVTPDFFRVFGEDPVLGRFFTPEDRQEDLHSVVLSYAMWQREFMRRPNRDWPERSGSGRPALQHRRGGGGGVPVSGGRSGLVAAGSFAGPVATTRHEHEPRRLCPIAQWRIGGAGGWAGQPLCGRFAGVNRRAGESGLWH